WLPRRRASAAWVAPRSPATTALRRRRCRRYGGVVARDPVPLPPGSLTPAPLGVAQAPDPRAGTARLHRPGGRGRPAAPRPGLGARRNDAERNLRQRSGRGHGARLLHARAVRRLPVHLRPRE